MVIRKTMRNEDQGSLLKLLYLLPPATKLGQDNVFTGVSDSVNEGGVSAPGGVCSWEGVCSRGCLLRGVPGGDPPGRPLLWAVRILLECILVMKAFVDITGYENGN